MRCPSDKCASTNIQHLPHYWRSLPGDSPLKGKYAQPAEGDRRARLIAAGVAALGVVLLVTGAWPLGLLALAGGGVGVWAIHGRITLADQARGKWSSTQICLACTHLWVP
ncbi:hypothetical protein OG900_33100 [Streptomyces sp. NBC_00433]